MATKQPTLEEVRSAIERHRAGFAALAARRPADGPSPEQAVLVAFDLALACFDNPWAIHGTTKKLVCDLVPGDNVLVLDQVSQRLVWRTVADAGVTREHTSRYDIPVEVFRVHWTEADAFLDVVSDDMAVTVDAATAYHAAYTHRLADHVAEGLAAVQHAMDTTTDAFGPLPADWCCRGECCGPGSWCCGRAGTHTHTGGESGSSLAIPDDCAPGDYKLVREYFIANYLDGDEGGRVTVDAPVLANQVAEIFSSSHWYTTRNEALIAAMRDVVHTDSGPATESTP